VIDKDCTKIIGGKGNVSQHLARIYDQLK